MYAMIAPVSFRVRWAEVTLIEEAGARIEPAFLIERKKRMAKRSGLETVDLQRIDYAELDLDAAALLSLFNYIVGNPDFSLVSAMAGSCCHNSKLLLDKNGKYLLVLYDFDSSGVIDARYAAPNTSLKIKDVTVRIYRGYCVHNPNLVRAKGIMNAAQEKYTSLVSNDSVLTDRYKKKMNKYLARSFKWVNRDADYQSKIINKCRGDV